MNNKGQVMFYGFMLGLVILILALALSPSVRDFTTSAMNQTAGDVVGLNCSNTTDNFIKVTCLATDLTLFYFIGILIFMAGAIVTAKIMFGGSNE